MSECICAEWKANIELVNGPIVLQAIRSGSGEGYVGKKFTHCPWCGTELSAPPAAPKEAT